MKKKQANYRKLVAFLRSNHNESVALGLILASQQKTLPLIVENELVLIAYLYYDPLIRQKAYDCLAKYHVPAQIHAWNSAFELFEIADDLYDAATFEANWYLFEQHEVYRLQLLNNILCNKDYVQRYYQLAQCISSYYRQKLDWAAKFMEMLIQQSPNNLNHLYLLANFYYHDMLDGPKARHYLEQMLHIDPFHQEAITALALLENDFYQGPQAGLKILEDAVSTQDSPSLEFLIFVFKTYLEDHQSLEEGIRGLENIAKTSNYYYEALSALAYAYSNRKQKYSLAQQYYLEILAYNPRDFYALAALADLQKKAQLDQALKATEYWKRAFSIYMDDPHYLVKYIGFLVLDIDEVAVAESYLDHLRDFCYKDIQQYDLWRFYKLNQVDRARFEAACQVIEAYRK